MKTTCCGAEISVGERCQGCGHIATAEVRASGFGFYLQGPVGSAMTSCQQMLRDSPQGEAIARVGLGLINMLLDKNRSYGNSALDPVRCFARELPPDAQLRVRIDDKISRILRGEELPGEDTEIDLIGYLILLLVERYYGETLRG